MMTWIALRVAKMLRGSANWHEYWMQVVFEIDGKYTETVEITLKDMRLTITEGHSHYPIQIPVNAAILREMGQALQEWAGQVDGGKDAPA